MLLRGSFSKLVVLFVLGLLPAAARAQGAGKLMPGEFDPNQALVLLYAVTPGQGGSGTSAPADAPSGAEGEDSGSTIRVLENFTFRQDGQERRLLLTEVVPDNPEDFTCHACAPQIGVGTFTRTPDGWRADAMEPFLTELGAYGQAPTPALVKIGPERHGVRFELFYMNQGISVTSAAFFVEAGGAVKETILAELGGDNGGNCAQEGDPDLADLPPCWSYESKLELVPGKNPEYFDLKVTTTGTRDGENGVAKVDGTATYVLTDGQYVRSSS